MIRCSICGLLWHPFIASGHLWASVLTSKLSCQHPWEYTLSSKSSCQHLWEYTLSSKLSCQHLWEYTLSSKLSWKNNPTWLTIRALLTKFYGETYFLLYTNIRSLQMTGSLYCQKYSTSTWMKILKTYVIYTCRRITIYKLGSKLVSVSRHPSCM